ncbi:nitroreductase [Aurantimicrobium minutum]|uniref:nitroreductase family protein n=1 Tax=Aurantimicrobium minutum TaxID=708131 RepID=UPI0024761C08|nr:nitroreductase family protein [Aurantimicrobium minutum]MDH6532279.1 nitroreductase [Aurantimicrobium minutum]
MTHVDDNETSLRTLAQARYRASYPHGDETLNETLALMLRHKSVRKYTSEPLSDHDLDLIITAAQSASSSSITQTWTVIAIRDKDRLKRISELLGGRAAMGNLGYVEECAVFLVWVADYYRAEQVILSQGVSPEDMGFLENTLVSFTDIGIASQNALLAAESLGLGGVYVGTLRNNPEGISAELGIPQGAFPALGMSIGHPDPSEGTGVKPRLPLETVLHHEIYNTEAWKPGVATYENTYRDYFAEQGVANASWIRSIVRRLGYVAGMKGRDKMQAELAKQGLDSR